MMVYIYIYGDSAVDFERQIRLVLASFFSSNNKGYMACIFMVVYYIYSMKNDLKGWVLANSTAET